jgi:hypothetical protein
MSGLIRCEEDDMQAFFGFWKTNHQKSYGF